MLVSLHIKLFSIIVLILLIFLTAAYLSLLERHVVAAVQQRVGPSSTILGILQPISDAFKLLTKKVLIPYRVYLVGFYLAPILTIALAIIIVSFIPVHPKWVFYCSEYSLLWVIMLFTINNYSVLLGS